MLVNMSSLKDADTFSEQKKLKGAALHGCGQPPADYGIKYIPHKVLVDQTGKIVKNFSVDLPKDLDELLANPTPFAEGDKKEEKEDADKKDD